MNKLYINMIPNNLINLFGFLRSSNITIHNLNTSSFNKELEIRCILELENVDQFEFVYEDFKYIFESAYTRLDLDEKIYIIFHDIKLNVINDESKIINTFFHFYWDNENCEWNCTCINEDLIKYFKLLQNKD